MKLASVVENSKNSKIGTMSATYTGYQTCSDGCPLKPVIGADGGFETAPCYASCDLVGVTMHRLTRASVSVDLVQIQAAECAGIEGLTGKHVLRLKVGGDTPNSEYARGLASSCAAYSAKQGQPAYGYTHNWREIPREAFGSISMLASCDKPSDIDQAKAAGYATAIVVSEFPKGNKAFMSGGNRIIPCPNQTASDDKPVQCVDCKLCFRDDKLRAHDITIGFRAHGRKVGQLQAELNERGL